MNKSTWVWTKPGLSRAGQTEFWNGQASTYETADMTIDNNLEIQRVIEYISSRNFSEIITLGGAVGCRDPLMMLQAVYCSPGEKRCLPGRKELPTIFFNDLASNQVARAKNCILSPCQQCGVKITFCAGPIHEAISSVGTGSRTLLVGVYDAEGFFRSDPQNGYPLAGFDEYIKNTVTLGEHFWFDLLVSHDGRLETYSLGIEVSADDPEWPKIKKGLLELFKKATRPLVGAVNPRQTIALQVVGAKKNTGGYFISHWFARSAICSLLQEVFPTDQFAVKEVAKFPKGMLYAIERLNIQQTGVITLLNNVLGNIIPDEQPMVLDSLKAII